LSGPSHLAVEDLGIALAAAAAGYALLAVVAVLLWRLRIRRAARAYRLSVRPLATGAEPQGGPPARLRAAVTVLKPLCGAEPGLYESLRSFCTQRAGGFQIVFGVSDPEDSAIPVVRRLQREFGELELDLSIDATVHGASLKVSNLINMMRVARHDLLVVADSDVQVGPDYLERVVAPLADPAVGIVTCPYRGRAEGGPWSRLLESFINDWFMPSVLVAATFGSRAFAFGATIALRRDALEAIGGFEAIADQLADDYRLGELTRKLGLRTVLSEVVVDTRVDEPRARDLLRHELRWLRTIRAVRPGGYASSFVTFALPVAALGWLVSSGAGAALALLAATGAARLLLHFAIRRAEEAVWQLWVLPFNDLLAFMLWCWGFVSRNVHWRQAHYRVARDGSARPIG
jgi:ceramide glucosyltransferase